MLPPLPPWEGMHPLLVHLPLGLAFVAPIPAALAVILPGRRHAFLSITLAVLLIALAGAMLAVLSGEAAEHLLQERGLETPAVHDTLEEHEELAETTRTALIILTLVSAGLVIGSRKGKVVGGVGAAASLVVLAGTLAAGVLLANAAHYGGLLVHHHGIHAPLGPGDDAATGFEADDD